MYMIVKFFSFKVVQNLHLKQIVADLRTSVFPKNIHVNDTKIVKKYWVRYILSIMREHTGDLICKA